MFSTFLPDSIRFVRLSLKRDCGYPAFLIFIIQNMSRSKLNLEELEKKFDQLLALMDDKKTEEWLRYDEEELLLEKIKNKLTHNSLVDWKGLRESEKRTGIKLAGVSREDIEDLGWKLHRILWEGTPSESYDYRIDSYQLFYCPVIPTSIEIDSEDEPWRLFNGKVFNKTDLRRLMNQLGII